MGRMSKASRRIVLALVAVVTATVMSGCGAPAPSPTPTPTALSEAEAYAAAEATYRAYVDALNRVDLADPATFEPVFALTTGELNEIDRRDFSQLHADGITFIGANVVRSVTPVDHSNGRVDLGVCYDVSATDLVTSTGDSIVDADRIGVQALQVSLQPSSSSSTFYVSRVGAWTSEQSC